MTDDLRTVCALTGEVLFGYNEYENKAALDWEKVYAFSRKQFVIPTTAYAVTDSIPGNLQKKWIMDVYGIEKQNYHVRMGNLRIHDLLQKNNIPYVVLKGLASTRYYRNWDFRAQGDVDFLVPADKTAETRKLLEENGFQEKGALDYEIQYRKDGVSFELHTEVNGIPAGEKSSIVREYLKDIIDTALPLETDGGIVMIPDEFHHGLVILLHTAKHLTGFGLGLRQLSDWAVFVNEIGERFPAIFEAALKKCGLWEFAKVLTAACVKYLHMKPLLWTGDQDDAFLERFMDDLLRKGGLRHDESDDLDTLLVENTDKGGYAASPMPVQLFINLGRKAQYKWPFLKKWKILIPFAILIMCIEYGIGMSTGKYRKIHPGAMTAKAAERKALYKELKLFE